MVTVNNEQKLFVISCEGGGFSCLGFDVADKKIKALAKEYNVTNLYPYEFGALEMYNVCRELTATAYILYRTTGKQSVSELTPEFIGKEGQRVEIVDCDGDKRRFIIGKSTGPIPCHLEIKTKRSIGGSAVYGTPFKSVKFL